MEFQSCGINQELQDYEVNLEGVFCLEAGIKTGPHHNEALAILASLENDL